MRRRRGYGFSALDKDIHSLGVFFYRGDSMGEGGSGNWWLNSQHLNKICDKLIDGGLIVTDGSNGTLGYESTYMPLWKNQFFTNKPIELPPKVKPFKDNRGHIFECVGFAGRNTLIWQVTKPSLYT